MNKLSNYILKAELNKEAKASLIVKKHLAGLVLGIGCLAESGKQGLKTLKLFKKSTKHLTLALARPIGFKNKVKEGHFPKAKNKGKKTTTLALKTLGLIIASPIASLVGVISPKKALIGLDKAKLYTPTQIQLLLSIIDDPAPILKHPNKRVENPERFKKFRNKFKKDSAFVNLGFLNEKQKSIWNNYKKSIEDRFSKLA